MYDHETREKMIHRNRQTAKRLLGISAATCFGLAILLACAACSYYPADAKLLPLAAANVLAYSAEPSVAAVQASPTPLPSAALTAGGLASASPEPSSISLTSAPKASPLKTAKPSSKPKARPTPKAIARKTACPTARPTVAPVKSPSGLSSKESMMIGLVNGERKKAGLKPLAYDRGLRAAALKHSQDMLEHSYFDHTSPIYGTFQQRLAASGVKYSTAGENIAYYASVQEAHAGLMNSPGHRANILNPAFTRIGIGIVYDKDKGMYYVTQWFAG